MVRRIRNTLPNVPRQTRPRMVVRSFRVREDVWEKFAAKAADAGENPTERVRDLVTEDAERE